MDNIEIKWTWTDYIAKAKVTEVHGVYLHGEPDKMSCEAGKNHQRDGQIPETDLLQLIANNTHEIYLWKRLR